MAAVGQSDSTNPVLAPGSDGSGNGVPSNSIFNNISGLATVIAADVAGVYRTVNSPAPQQTYTFGSVNQPIIGNLGLVPILLILGAAWLIFK